MCRLKKVRCPYHGKRTHVESTLGMPLKKHSRGGSPCPPLQPLSISSLLAPSSSLPSWPWPGSCVLSSSAGQTARQARAAKGRREPMSSLARLVAAWQACEARMRATEAPPHREECLGGEEAPFWALLLPPKNCVHSHVISLKLRQNYV